jgi:hypothetical protein
MISFVGVLIFAEQDRQAGCLLLFLPPILFSFNLLHILDGIYVQSQF